MGRDGSTLARVRLAGLAPGHGRDVPEGMSALRRNRSLQSRDPWARFSTCSAHSCHRPGVMTPQRSFHFPTVRASCSIFQRPDDSSADLSPVGCMCSEILCLNERAEMEGGVPTEHLHRQQSIEGAGGEAGTSSRAWASETSLTVGCSLGYDDTQPWPRAKRTLAQKIQSCRQIFRGREPTRTRMPRDM